MATRIQWFNRHMPNLVAGDWQTTLGYPGTIGLLPEALQPTARKALEHGGTIWVGIRWVNHHGLAPAWAVVATWPDARLVCGRLFRRHWQYQAQLAEAVAELT